MHRGLVISVIQAIFIVLFSFVTLSVYQGYLMLGYSTVFTMFPVFSIIFDEDVDDETAMNYVNLNHLFLARFIQNPSKRKRTKYQDLFRMVSKIF